jgi:hypothetical protein
MLRQLEHLSLRIWDSDSPKSKVESRKSKVHSPQSEVDQPAAPKRVSAKAGPSLARRSAEREGGSNNARAAERLQHVQRLLDLLNAGGRSPQEIRLVRDARWLIQTAQGPLTRHVRPYFIKAGYVSTLNEARLEIHRAGAVLAGGHLRSQLRHLSRRTGWAFDDPQLLALTRSSNSMDMALLVRDLVPLLDAYSAACVRQDGDARLALADAILQGFSADPELLLTRLDLLAPSTMIEDLFVDRRDAGSAFALRSHIATADKTPGYTEMGEVHRECLARYGELVGRVGQQLKEDAVALAPPRAGYTPFGLIYGFCADLLSNMVLNTLRSSSAPDLSLEDMFTSTGRLEEKRSQADEWERLAKAQGERAPFEHSSGWAAQMFARTTAALEARAARPAEANASRFRKACLYVVPRATTVESVSEAGLPDGIVSAQEHCLTSDVARARLTGATALPADRLIADRAEGRLLACVHSEGGWFGVSKIALTLYTSQGTDALITGVPPEVIDVLRVVCPEILVALPNA